MTHRQAASGLTALFGITVAFGTNVATASTAMHHMSGPSAATLVKGKSLTAKYHCNSCHGPNLGGRPGFSPSLHVSGVTHEYTLATWVKVLQTGVTNDGGKVKKPMPIYAKMSKADAGSIYTYVRSLK